MPAAESREDRASDSASLRRTYRECIKLYPGLRFELRNTPADRSAAVRRAATAASRNGVSCDCAAVRGSQQARPVRSMGVWH